MLIKNLLLPGVIVPTVCAAVALAASVWWGRRGSTAALRGGSLALGAAFLSAYVAITGWPRFPPVESTQRLFYWVAIISLIAFAWGRAKDIAPPWPIRGGAIAFLLWGMLRAPIENTWSPGEAALWLSGLFVVGLAMMRALESSLTVTGARRALEAAVVRLAVLGGGAVVLGLSGTARLAQLMGAVACGALVVEVVALKLRRRPWLAGDAMALATAVYGLFLGGYFYAQLETWPAVSVALAFVLLGLGSRPGAAWRWVPLVPLGAALALVVWAYVNQEEDPYGDYGSLGVSVEQALGRVEGNTGPAGA